MIVAEIAGDRITVTAPDTYKDVMKRIPGARYGPGWTVPLSFAACKQLRAEFGEMLQVGDQLAAWATNYVMYREDTLLPAQRGEITYEGINPLLWPPQRLAVAWMVAGRRVMLTDEMRTGKTPTTIEAIRLLGADALPALIISTNTTKWMWKDEFAKWAPEIQVQVIHGTAAQRRKQILAGADVQVLNWEGIRNHSRLAPYGNIELTDKEKTRGDLNEVGFRTVVADEAHRAIDPKSKQTRAFWFLAHEARYRYALTGTPVRNRPSDLFSIGHALVPEEYPVRTSWVERYCLAGQGRFGWEIFGLRPEHQAELFEILDPRLLRRTLREVRPYMPDRLPDEVRTVDLEASQAKLYKALKKDMMALVDDEILVEKNAMTLAGRLSQVAAATPVLEGGQVVSLKEPSVKMDAMRDIISEAPGEPLVVFAASRKLIELAEKVLDRLKIPYSSIHGGVDPQLRAANVARFQIGETQVALCTYGAGAEGITLNRASRTLLLQRSWKALENLQARARTDGKENGDPLQTIISEVRGTIEERTRDVDTEKAGYLQEILRDHLRDA